jgi:hypothetical protein
MRPPFLSKPFKLFRPKQLPLAVCDLDASEKLAYEARALQQEALPRPFNNLDSG